MEPGKIYDILKDIVAGMSSRGEGVRPLPADIRPDEPLDRLGIDLIAFSDIMEELRRRLGGRDLHLNAYMNPEEYYYLTLGKLLEIVGQSFTPSSKSPVVVYVDDEEENLFVFKRKLGKHLDLKTFIDPREALEYIKSEPRVSLVITDEVMPGLKGNALCDEVRKAKPFMRFILITGNPDGDENLMYKSLRGNRFYEFINKPLDLEGRSEEYLKVIREAMG